MTQGAGCEVIVLLEDKRSNQFARRVLKQLGFENRRTRYKVAPSGAGAGAQWVRLNYVEEVNSHRRRRNHLRVALLAVVDADTKSVKERHQEFDAALKNAGQQRRDENERIAMWVPKRHMETWLAFLTGKEVGEEKDVKGTETNFDPDLAASRFVKQYHDEKPPSSATLPSLTAAYVETRRLFVHL